MINKDIWTRKTLLDTHIQIVQQIIGIPMRANCAPFLVDLLFYSYESEYIHKRFKDKIITDWEAKAFNSACRHTNVESIKIQQEREVKETTETTLSASFLDIYFKFDTDCLLSTRLYDKRGDFSFLIINFPP